MSRATKRKHVTREVEQDLTLPQQGQTIVKVVAGRGNNLHEVVDEKGESFLVSMPTKFRKNVWIKRGDFVLVSPIEEGDKVKAEIITILYKEQIKHIKNENLWPEGFKKQEVSVEKDIGKLDINKGEEGDNSNCDSESEDDSDIFQNTNRPVYEASAEESDTEDEQ